MISAIIHADGKIEYGKARSCENQKRATLYRAAFGRIAHARRQGFPIETIALEEGIIADRRRSLLRTAKNKKATAKTCVSDLLVAVKRLDLTESEQMLLEISRWLGSRNEVVHGIVARRDGSLPSNSPDAFFAKADQIAEQGESLAHGVSNWVGRMKTKIKKSECGEGQA